MPGPFQPPLESSEIQIVFPELNNIEIIKSGGEGTVAKAFNSKINAIVAIKIYAPDHLINRNILEVNKLSKITSPYFIALYNYGQVVIRGIECFYTETSYVEGQDLKKKLQSGKVFSSDEIKKLIKCIAKAIDILWSEKVVHCDIKPDNILQNGDDFILIDLGIAKYIDEPTMTQNGMIMGTKGYIAPEQINGRRNLTFKADYYSLGIVAFELLAGYHPFNYNQYMIMNKSKLPDFPPNINVPTKIRNLIYLLTDPIPYKRPLNYDFIISMLEGD